MSFVYDYDDELVWSSHNHKSRGYLSWMLAYDDDASLFFGSIADPGARMHILNWVFI